MIINKANTLRFLSPSPTQENFLIEDKIIIEHEGCLTATGNTLDYRGGNGWLLLS